MQQRSGKLLKMLSIQENLLIEERLNASVTRIMYTLLHSLVPFFAMHAGQRERS